MPAEQKRTAESWKRQQEFFNWRQMAEQEKKAREQAALRQQAQARSNWSNRVRLANEATRDAAAAAEANRRIPVQNLFGEAAPAPTPIEMFVGRQEQAQRQAQNAPVWDMMLYGEQKESALPGQQRAGKLESFIRTQAGEDEFRIAGQRFSEGRPAAGAGWGLLGLAGLVPLAGDVAQVTAKGARAANAFGFVGNISRGSSEVVQGVQTSAAPLIRQGILVPQSGAYLDRTIQTLRNRVKDRFSLEATDGRSMPNPRDPSDAVAIFDEIIDNYAPGLVNSPINSGPYVPDFNRAKGINNAISDEIIAEISRRLNVKPHGANAAVTPRLAQQFAETLSSLDLTVATDLQGLVGFMRTGRYGNAFEIGRTNSGSWWPGFRASNESVMFGIAEDVDASARPVYGFLSRRPGVQVNVPDDLPGMARSIDPNSAYQYGDIRLRFGQSTMNRSTMTAGDSIRLDYTPVPISDPSMQNMAMGNFNRVNGNTYIETQTIGGLNSNELIGIDVPKDMVEQVRAIVGDAVPIFPY